MEASLLRSLECPICFEPSTPPIFTCFKGHHVCSTCRPHIKVCGVCMSPMSMARNWLAEDISLKIVKVPCKNTHLGCTKRLYMRDLSNHLQLCPWSVNCTVLTPPCRWRGPLGELVPHMCISHLVHDKDSQSAEYPVIPGTSSSVLVSVRDALYQGHFEYCASAGGWHPYCRRMGQPDATPAATFEFEMSARDAPFRLRYADRVLDFSEVLRKDSLPFVNAKLLDKLTNGGHEVFFTFKIVCVESE